MPTAALSSTSAEGAFLSSLSPLSPRGMTDLGCFPSLLPLLAAMGELNYLYFVERILYL